MLPIWQETNPTSEHDQTAGTAVAAATTTTAAAAAVPASEEKAGRQQRCTSWWTSWLAVGDEEEYKIEGRRRAYIWVVRCRIAAVISGALLVAAFIVSIVLAFH